MWVDLTLCDCCSTIKQKLDADKGITNKNVMLYLIQIEKRIDELLKVIFFEKMQTDLQVCDNHMSRCSVINWFTGVLLS